MHPTFFETLQSRTAMEQIDAEKLRLLKAHLRLRQATEVLRTLKVALHEEVDALESAKGAEEEAQQLAAAHADAEGRCAYGEPDWDGAGAGGDGDTEQGCPWGPWMEGKEVQYTAEWSTSGMQVVAMPAQPVQLQLSREPFAHGGMRLAFYARDEVGGRFVVKRPLLEERSTKRRLRSANLDAHITAVCQAVAGAFCHPGYDVPASIAFLPGSVVVLEDPDQLSTKLVLLKEPYIYAASAPSSASSDSASDKEPASADSSHSSRSTSSGGDASTESAPSSAARAGTAGSGSSTRPAWLKWTLNNGDLLPAGKQDEVIQALTHFSLHFSEAWLGQQCLVLDVQGICSSADDPSGSTGQRRRRYTLTDPALCSVDKRYGPLDWGNKAVNQFFKSHKCGRLCRRLGNRPLGAAEP